MVGGTYIRRCGGAVVLHICVWYCTRKHKNGTQVHTCIMQYIILVLPNFATV